MMTDYNDHSHLRDHHFAPRGVPACCFFLLTTIACGQPSPSEGYLDVDTGTTTDDKPGEGGDSMTTVADSGDGDGDPGDGDGDPGDGDGDGDGDPGDGDGDGDGDDPHPIEDSLYPLVDGAQWTYLVTTTGGQVLGMDITYLEETTWNGSKAWDLIDEPNDEGKWNSSVIMRIGDLIARVHREEMIDQNKVAIIDYDPGFVRVSEAWTSPGIMEELFYDRTAFDGQGQNPDVEPRGHTFEVLAVDEEVTVPAGTFNCVKIERVRTVGTESGALAWYWYAPGIGKVREERPIEMEVEELVSVSIPGGAELP